MVVRFSAQMHACSFTHLSMFIIWSHQNNDGAHHFRVDDKGTDCINHVK